MTTAPRSPAAPPGAARHRAWRALALAVLLGAAVLSAQAPPPKPATAPPAPGVVPAAFARLDTLIHEAIAAGQAPGAVVLVGRGDRVLYQKAYGRRAVVPASEPMTLDTVFDLASLTKVVATTTAVMTLVEQGRLRLNDAVAAHVPGFGRHGKGDITVRHLLTHVSGLRPDVDLGEAWSGHDAAIDLACDEVPVAAPGERFVYSDINFFLLGHLVSTIAGESLDAYTRRVVFGPLGMRDTLFVPPPSLLARIAPTERCAPMDAWPCKRPDAPPLRGVVHDPTARRMGGVAGHAGLFSTAGDLSRFARMLVNGGALGPVRVLSRAAVKAMTAPATPAGMPSVRGLGWDINTAYSANRGDLFPIGSFGHTGFTGTGLWIDPTSQGWVVFLSSRLHPDGAGDVTALRGRVANVAAAALTGATLSSSSPEPFRTLQNLSEPFRTLQNPSEPFRTFQNPSEPFRTFQNPSEPLRTSQNPSIPPPVLPGIDVLATGGFARLAGKRVGLVTNHSGLAADGQSTIDILHQAPGVTLVALFSPEHGIRGTLDEDVAPSRDEKTGLPIHSLYGDTRRPTDAMLQGIDTLVVDVQDIGVRFYTYESTMAYVLEEAARRKIAVVVLDRPNPVNGWQIEGPFPDAPLVGWLSYVRMPIRHGLTMGELARLFNDENRIGADLTVVPMANWRRDMWFDETGLAWVNPSPNMRNLTQAALYPGIGAIEYSNISVGRGTDQPFEQIGAPWIDGRRLAAALNARRLPGIRFYPVTFTPKASKYVGEACQGVFLVVTNRAVLQPVRVGLEVAAALSTLHGDRYRFETTERLLGSRVLLERVGRGEDPGVVAGSWAGDEAAWRRLRARYLLYR